MATIRERYTLFGLLSGVVSATDANNADRMQKAFTVPGTSGNMKLTMQMTGCGGLGDPSGETVFRLSDEPFDGDGDTLDLTVDGGDPVSDMTEDALVLAAGSRVYLFVASSDAYPTNAEITVYVESVDSGESAGDEPLTAGDVLDRFEYLMADASNARWTQANFWIWCGDAQRELLAERPDLQMSEADESLLTPVDPITASGELIPPLDYALCLAHFCCSRAFQQDASDQKNLAAAKQHYADFLRLAGVAT
ncbi:MAG TPA: hypothetical protein PLG73_02485 [Candidatus Sumerlaeota bacterium]|nr:hypothetical protein [Candidatus Sumerlaeota bacterium]